jgi:hypothetical protein
MKNACFPTCAPASAESPGDQTGKLLQSGRGSPRNEKGPVQGLGTRANICGSFTVPSAVARLSISVSGDNRIAAWHTDASGQRSTGYRS